MASATNILERDILMAFGQGIAKWVDQENGEEITREDVTMLGRWQDAARMDRHFLDYDYTEGYRDCDLAVIFGSWKPREKGTHITRGSVASQAKNFVCIETPLLKRETKAENTYWRVGLNGFLCRDATWPRVDVSLGQQRLANMGLHWQGWKNNRNGHILVALQLPGDASLRGIDINDWALRAIQNIRGYTDKFIVVRSHPMTSQRGFETHAELARNILMSGVQNIKFSDGAERSWDEDIADAYCTVTYTSGLAVDSVYSGIPTVACDPGNFAWGISTNEFHDINDVMKRDEDTINQWLGNLSYCQWTLDEMRNGDTWQMLRSILPATVR